jgi:hypothetical protein
VIPYFLLYPLLASRPPHCQFCYDNNAFLDVIRALTRAIEVIEQGEHDPLKAHERVKGMYAWKDVAERTELVYHRVMEQPLRDTFERLSR